MPRLALFCRRDPLGRGSQELRVKSNRARSPMEIVERAHEIGRSLSVAGDTRQYGERDIHEPLAYISQIRRSARRRRSSCTELQWCCSTSTTTKQAASSSNWREFTSRPQLGHARRRNHGPYRRCEPLGRSNLPRPQSAAPIVRQVSYVQPRHPFSVRAVGG